MKTLKKSIVLLLCLITITSFSQTEVKPDERFKTELKSFKTEYYYGLYSNIMYSAYQYPSIRDGFYTVGFFLRYTDLITLYEELINISKMDDGEYKLSVKMENITMVKKVKTNLYFKCLRYSTTNYKPYYNYNKKITTKYLESDLEIIKTKFINYKNL